MNEKFMNTVFIELGHVKCIRYYSKPGAINDVSIYLGKYSVDKILNTNLLRVIALEDGTIGTKTKINKGETLYLSENNIIEMRK